MYLIIFIFSSLGLGAIIGVYSKNTSSMVLIGQAIFLPSVLFSGAMFPTEMLPEPMQYITFIFPASLGMKVATQTDNVLIIFIVLLLVSTVCLVFSFRKTMKLPKI